MPTLKKLINQIEHNDQYIDQINKIIIQDEQSYRILRGLENRINFETQLNEYKLTIKFNKFKGFQSYKFTITKNNKDYLNGMIAISQRIQKPIIKVNYDFDKDIPELNDDIVQLFKVAI